MHGIMSRLPANMTHTWKYMGHASDNPMGVELVRHVAGLGFVLSFGYWCTNFLVVQRAMAADSMSAARRTPLIGTIPKCSCRRGDSARHRRRGLASMTGVGGVHLYNLPTKLSHGVVVGDYDQVLTTLMAASIRPACWRGPHRADGIVHVRHGGNVTAFNTVFTYDIYQSYIARAPPTVIT